jgi:hypothetical protein
MPKRNVGPPYPTQRSAKLATYIFGWRFGLYI